jgi:uncharacterized protein YjbI with pentapeptide repeats
MANQEQLKILKAGLEKWNAWRKNHPGIILDLSNADLSKVDLSKKDLSGADLKRANLTEAYLHRANLREANLNDANLHGANLSGANLGGANLSEAILISANLQGANLHGANLSIAKLGAANLIIADLSEAILSGAKLNDANLTEARLINTNLIGANLSRAVFTQTVLFNTVFVDVDLSECIDLGGAMHLSPSRIGIDTIYRSRGKIPHAFLRGIGVPDNFIEYMGSLTGTAFDYYSCFISYSAKDQEFAERLYADLQTQGVRCWFAPEDFKIGQKIRPGIDEAIRIHDKLLLVLSESSVKSAWVEKEVETAFEKERKEDKTVLFPVRLDEAVFQTDVTWAADIRRTRHIGDFRNWQKHADYKKAFERLLRDLKADKQKTRKQNGIR